MLKIDERLTLPQIPEYINEQLRFIETFSIRFMVVVVVFC